MTKRRKVEGGEMPYVDGDHGMNWRELCEADDLATMITVDAYLGFTTHKMSNSRNRVSDRNLKKWRDVILEFQQNKNYEEAYNRLTKDEFYVKKSWRNDSRFVNHIYRYLYLFDDRSGIQIRPCNRYAHESHVGAAIYSTKPWDKGERIYQLIGCIAEMNREEEREFLKHRQNDYSVMYSSRKACSQLWLGPAAYVNHDCRPNCEFTAYDVEARTVLEARRDIRAGDEILIYYGDHFFDANNAACECYTCEILQMGYFAPSPNVDASPHNTDSSNHSKPEASYSLRHTDARIDRIKKSREQARKQPREVDAQLGEEHWDERSMPESISEGSDSDPCLTWDQRYQNYQRYRSILQDPEALKCRGLTRYDAQVIVESGLDLPPPRSLLPLSLSNDSDQRPLVHRLRTRRKPRLKVTSRLPSLSGNLSDPDKCHPGSSPPSSGRTPPPPHLEPETAAQSSENSLDSSETSWKNKITIRLKREVYQLRKNRSHKLQCQMSCCK